MKKWIGILCAMALVFGETSAASATNLPADQTQEDASPSATPDWWTDHGPNHKGAAPAELQLDWWTDHGPNHKQKDPIELTVLWWTDHGPNH